jgi:4,5-dihydroxyphthalate decarboxylase
VDASRPTPAAFLGFAFEQGVTHRPVDVDELFPAEVRRSFRV